MKTLYLLRHAKSSWDYPERSDHERPLNKRGEQDAPKMGKWLSTHVQPPQLILCSDSLRTKTTAEAMVQAWQLKPEQLLMGMSLYHASEQDLWNLVQECEHEVDTLMLVGHNPGLTDFANTLSKQFKTENMPTTAFVAFSFYIDHWKEAKPKEATFETYQFPKNL